MVIACTVHYKNCIQNNQQISKLSPPAVYMEMVVPTMVCTLSVHDLKNTVLLPHIAAVAKTRVDRH